MLKRSKKTNLCNKKIKISRKIREKYFPLIKLISTLKNNEQRDILYEILPNQALDVLCEFLYNAAYSQKCARITRRVRLKNKFDKTTIANLKLLCRSRSNKKRRHAVKQAGGAIGAILGAALPALISLISGLVKK